MFTVDAGFYLYTLWYSLFRAKNEAETSTTTTTTTTDLSCGIPEEAFTKASELIKHMLFQTMRTFNFNLNGLTYAYDGKLDDWFAVCVKRAGDLYPALQECRVMTNVIVLNGCWDKRYIRSASVKVLIQYVKNSSIFVEKVNTRRFKPWFASNGLGYGRNIFEDAILSILVLGMENVTCSLGH